MNKRQLSILLCCGVLYAHGVIANDKFSLIESYTQQNEQFPDDLDDDFDAIEAELEASFLATDSLLEARYNAVHDAIQAAYEKQTAKIKVIWPKDVKVPQGSVWVAYSDDYNERITYDFEQGFYQIEVSNQGDTAANVNRLADLANNLATKEVDTIQAMDNFGRAIVEEVQLLEPAALQQNTPAASTNGITKIEPQLAKRSPNSSDAMRRALLKPANYQIIASVSAPSPKINVQKLLEQLATKQHKIEQQGAHSESATAVKPSILDEPDNKPISSITDTTASIQIDDALVQIDQTPQKWSIKIPFVNNYQQTLIDQRMQTINKMSQRFNVDVSIILAIIEAESSFNPMATSHIPAFGLMQLVPKTAGVDAYNHVYGQQKILSPEYLYDVENNLELGTAYIDVLQSRYLRGIKNSDNKLYSMIASYNTGVGNLANTVSGSKRIRGAINRINDMQPAYYYNFLQENLPAVETKRYLQKVISKRKKYQHLDEQ